MTYRQTTFPRSATGTLTSTLPAATHLYFATPTSPSPFRAATPLRRLRRAALLKLLRLAEWLLGTQLLVKDRFGPLTAFTPETISLLQWLSARGHLESWSLNQLVPGVPPNAQLYLTPVPFVTPSGKRFVMQGATGFGSGATLQEAALPALGEFIERFSTASDWWQKDVGRKTVRELEAARVSFVDPAVFRVWAAGDPGPYNERSAPPDGPLRWVEGYEVATGGSVLMPASLAYTFFGNEFTDEPILGETNSNGSAAHVTAAMAEYGAIIEAIERDAFLRAWYLKKVPRQISLASLGEAIPAFKPVVEYVAAHEKLHLVVLDITSPLGVPTVAAVLTNRNIGARAVVVSAAADMNPRRVLEKTVTEATQFLHTAPPITDEARRHELLERFFAGEVENYHARKLVWSQPETIAAVEWFTAGDNVITADEFLAGGSCKDADRRQRLRACLSEHDLALYGISFQNDLTRRSGLAVVRVLAPGLLPMFFNEANRPLNRGALKEARENGAPVNQIPHPFI